eukprot:11400-Heterococcus_DN1.PRE.1
MQQRLCHTMCPSRNSICGMCTYCALKSNNMHQQLLKTQIQCSYCCNCFSIIANKISSVDKFKT